MSAPTPQDLAQAVRKGTLEDVLALIEAGLGRDQPAELGLGLAMASFLGRREIVRELVRRGAPLNLPAGLIDASPIMMAVKGGQTKTVRLLVSYGAKVPPGVDTGLTHEEYAEALAKARARRHAAEKKTKKTSSRRSHAETSPPPAKPAAAPPRREPAIVAAPAQANAVRPAPVAAITPAPPPPAPPAPRIEPPPLEFVFTPPPPPSPAMPRPAAPAPRQYGSIVEEIEIEACFGLDTNVLEGDLLRLGLVEVPEPTTPPESKPSSGKK